MGVIPATVDQVMVGYHPKPSGSSEGTVFRRSKRGNGAPEKRTGEAFLSDRDRAALRKMDIELAPTVKEDGCIQKFYLYLMMSKPSPTAGAHLCRTYAGRQEPETLQSYGRSGKAVSRNENPGRAFRGMASADREGCQGAAYTGASGNAGTGGG